MSKRLQKYSTQMFSISTCPFNTILNCKSYYKTKRIILNKESTSFLHAHIINIIKSLYQSKNSLNNHLNTFLPNKS